MGRKARKQVNRAMRERLAEAKRKKEEKRAQSFTVTGRWESTTSCTKEVEKLPTPPPQEWIEIDGVRYPVIVNHFRILREVYVDRDGSPHPLSPSNTAMMLGLLGAMPKERK